MYPVCVHSRFEVIKGYHLHYEWYSWKWSATLQGGDTRHLAVCLTKINLTAVYSPIFLPLCVWIFAFFSRRDVITLFFLHKRQLIYIYVYVLGVSLSIVMYLLVLISLQLHCRSSCFFIKTILNAEGLGAVQYCFVVITMQNTSAPLLHKL